MKTRSDVNSEIESFKEMETNEEIAHQLRLLNELMLDLRGLYTMQILQAAQTPISQDVYDELRKAL